MKFNFLSNLWNTLSDFNNCVYKDKELDRVLDHFQKKGYQLNVDAPHPAKGVSDLYCMVLEKSPEEKVEIYLKNPPGQNQLSKDFGVYKVGHIEIINKQDTAATSVSELSKKIKTQKQTTPVKALSAKR